MAIIRRQGKWLPTIFFDRGFHHYAFAGFSDMFWSNARAESFDRAVAKAGYQCHHYNCRSARYAHSWEREQAKLGDWLQSLPKPVALMACNDDHGRHILDACKVKGLRIPSDVAVLGVDNDELVCDLSNPPLSSIALGTRKAGYEAAGLLERMMTGEDVGGQQIIVPALQVVTRQSTDIFAVEDEDVAKALLFIREVSNKTLIQVDDVVEAAATSRRSLERKFKKHIGRSIYSEIKHQRVLQIEKLLLETDLTVTEISVKMGFSCLEQLARYFREAKAMSPRDFRRQNIL